MNRNFQSIPIGGSAAMLAYHQSLSLCQSNPSMIDAADEASMNYLANLQQSPSQVVQVTKGGVRVPAFPGKN